MKCKWCGGTGKRAAHVAGCEHCDDTGVQVDPPFGDGDVPDEVLSNSKVTDICNRVFAMHLPTGPTEYDTKLHLVDVFAKIIHGVTLPQDDRHALATFWSTSTCNDTYGDIVQRVAKRCFLHATS